MGWCSSARCDVWLLLFSAEQRGKMGAFLDLVESLSLEESEGEGPVTRQWPNRRDIRTTGKYSLAGSDAWLPSFGG